jgi:hypothetical protein
LLCSALWSPAHAARWNRAPGTSFKAETKGSPVSAMAGHWEVEGRSARIVFAGAQVLGDKTHMRATWTTRFGPKTRTARVTVECNRLSGSMEDKANRWSVEVLIVPKAGFGREAFAYRTRLPMPEVGSGEGMSVSVQSFRPQRWRYHVALEANLVTPSELSGTCTMEAL